MAKQDKIQIKANLNWLLGRLPKPNDTHHQDFIPSLHLPQEWKAGNHATLGNVRPYEPNPPPPAPGREVDPSKFPLRLARVDIDPSPALKGWDKYRVSIPPAARARHMEDAIFGEEWKRLLHDFDKKYLV